jgi:hypothetical protein
MDLNLDFHCLPSESFDPESLKQFLAGCIVHTGATSFSLYVDRGKEGWQVPTILE